MSDQPVYALSGAPDQGASGRAAVRQAAITAASHAVPAGSPPGHFLSTARAFDRYVTTGLSQVAAERTERLVVGVEGLLVEVDKKRFTPDQAQQFEADVLAAATRLGASA